ncbi:hypothetical protein [Marinobacterium halophilum]|nr:hypothetical protein [Marinobacterium halophilum]
MFGLYEAAIFLKGFTALYLLSILSRVGIDLHLLRESSSEECNGKFYIFGKEGAFLLIPLLLSFSFFIVFFLLNTFVFMGMLNNYYWVLISLPAFSCLGIISNLLKSKGKDLWGAITEVGIVSLVTAVVLFIIPRWLVVDLEIGWYFATVSWFSFVFSFLIIFLSLEKDKAIFNIRLIFGSSWVYLLNQVSSYLSQWFPIFLFGGYENSDYIVYYSVANRIATVISFFGITIDSYSAPRFSKMWAAGKIDEVWSFKNKLDKISFFISMFGFVFVSTFGVLYGYVKSYEFIYFVFVLVLVLFYAASVGMGPNGFFLMMTDSNNYVTLVTTCICLSVIVFSLVGYVFNALYLLVFLVGGGVFFRSFIFRLKVKRKRV